MKMEEVDAWTFLFYHRHPLDMTEFSNGSMQCHKNVNKLADLFFSFIISYFRKRNELLASDNEKAQVRCIQNVCQCVLIIYFEEANLKLCVKATKSLVEVFVVIVKILNEQQGVDTNGHFLFLRSAECRPSGQFLCHKIALMFYAVI